MQNHTKSSSYSSLRYTISWLLYFRDMIHAFDVIILNKATFDERIVPSWYNIEAAKLMEELKSTDHVSLTSECWNSRTTIPYLTITAHYANEVWIIVKGPTNQNSWCKTLRWKHIFALNSALESWQIAEKVTVITTVYASNMGRASVISDIYLKIGSFAHTLDLAEKKAVELISKKENIKLVIPFLHRSHKGAKVLKKKTKKQEALNVPSHQPITDVDMRWNST